MSELENEVEQNGGQLKKFDPEPKKKQIEEIEKLITEKIIKAIDNNYKNPKWLEDPFLHGEGYLSRIQYVISENRKIISQASVELEKIRSSAKIWQRDMQDLIDTQKADLVTFNPKFSITNRPNRSDREDACRIYMSGHYEALRAIDNLITEIEIAEKYIRNKSAEIKEDISNLKFQWELIRSYRVDNPGALKISENIKMDTQSEAEIDNLVMDNLLSPVQVENKTTDNTENLASKEIFTSEKLLNVLIPETVKQIQEEKEKEKDKTKTSETKTSETENQVTKKRGRPKKEEIEKIEEPEILEKTDEQNWFTSNNLDDIFSMLETKGNVTLTNTKSDLDEKIDIVETALTLQDLLN